MKLADWLKRENVSNSEFARRTGLSESMVSLLCREIPDPRHGRATWPSEQTAQIIYRETGGEVTPNDFFKPEAAQ